MREKSTKKPNNKLILVISIFFFAIAGVLIYFVAEKKFEQIKPSEPPISEKNKNNLVYEINDNSLGDFDLKFLKLENNRKNKIYSPLSIKYALLMLKEGANNETRKQIDTIIGEYSARKYPNNNNMSFANAMFIKNSYKNFVKDTYILALNNAYNAEVIYDSFDSTEHINSWISEKTFKLINNLLTDITNKDFILVNALAIDMEWINKIQAEEADWHVSYIHEDYSKYIGALSEKPDEVDFHSLKFNNNQNVASVEIGAVINKYDIVKIMGEKEVKEIVGNAYQKWLNDGAPNSCYENINKEPDRKTFVNNYIKEINENYKELDKSTDFSFYVDDDVKVFAKDLKEYSNMTLEYIGIMPNKIELNEFIKNITADDINDLLTKIKPLELESFKEGVITEISGFIPMFKFDYKLDLKSNLKRIGITDIFDEDKADLSNLTTNKAFITDALHQANIEFSNSGIKAAAVTVMDGYGAGECGFDYIFKIPEERIEKIDLTFDKPYLFLIVNKETKEVWFTGTVYEPAEYSSYIKSIQTKEEY